MKHILIEVKESKGIIFDMNWQREESNRIIDTWPARGKIYHLSSILTTSLLVKLAREYKPSSIVDRTIKKELPLHREMATPFS